MKRALLCFMLLCVVSCGWLGAGSATAAPAQDVAVHAEAAALIDVTSGRILYSLQGDKQLPIASLTKIMTAIVAIEAGNLSDQVTVSRNAFGKEGSSIYLKLGEQMSLNNLLYGMMLRSGNDAATAIAEHIGGSVDGFAYLMNEKARGIGMTSSHFTNPHGLDQAGHYSTADDMAKLTAYALHNPVFQGIVKTQVKKVPNPGEAWDHVWSNKNKMLALYPGADGVKTGYTKVAKRCLVSSATRGGQQLAVVTLNDSDDWVDHAKLLDYGFSHFPLKTLVHKGEQVEGGFVAANTLQYPLNTAEAGLVTRKMVLSEAQSADYRLGIAGKLQLLMNGTQVGAVPLYPAGSPRLEWSSQSTFSFHADSVSAGRLSRFTEVWQKLFRAVFTLQNQ